jgi:hypothetical protein
MMIPSSRGRDEMMDKDEFKDVPATDVVRINERFAVGYVSGDYLWQGAEEGWYVFELDNGQIADSYGPWLVRDEAGLWAELFRDSNRAPSR